MDSSSNGFDGSGGIKVFIEKVSIHSLLKGYEGERATQNIAGRLEGRAFDVYMRLGASDKKDPSKIKCELLEEFERGNQDREVAINVLVNRTRSFDESPQTFAFKIQELVSLAHPAFHTNTCNTIANGYFIKGLHPKMQVALKSLPVFVSASISQLATETVRLEIAGIDSWASKSPLHRRGIFACR